jgi:hypothetical protein
VVVPCGDDPLPLQHGKMRLQLVSQGFVLVRVGKENRDHAHFQERKHYRVLVSGWQRSYMCAPRSQEESPMQSWKVRQVRIYVPGDTPQWCIDNGEDDLVPCGEGDAGKAHADKLAETLNLGHVVKARDANRNPDENLVISAAKQIYTKCQEIDLLAQQFPKWPENPKIEEIRAKLVELQQAAFELQHALFR